MDMLIKFVSKIKAFFTNESKEVAKKVEEVIETDVFSNLNKELYVNNRYLPDEMFEQSLPAYFIRYNKEKDSYRLLLLTYIQKYNI